MQILNRVWKHKTLSPCIKAFIWRLVRRAIATGDRAGRYSTNISKQCDTCQINENDAHLFFHCTFARAVFSANPPICTSDLPHEQDGVQEMLPIILGQHTSSYQMQVTLTTLWYIWKARNDKRFNNKNWMVRQVHNAVAADIKASLLYVLQDDEQAHQDLQGHTAGPNNDGGHNPTQVCFLQMQVQVESTAIHLQHRQPLSIGFCCLHYCQEQGVIQMLPLLQIRVV